MTAALNASHQPKLTPLLGFTCLGLLLGLGGYFNGATTIAGLLIITVLIVALPQKKALSACLITALATLIASKLLVSGPAGSSLAPSIHIGFLAKTASLWGVSRYVWLTFGLLPLAAIMGWWLHRRQNPPLTPWFWALASPALLAFVIQLNPDVASNHKFISISILLLNGWVAALLVWLIQHPKRLQQGVGILLTVLLTLTGLFDWAVLTRQLSHHHALNLKDPVLAWAIDQSPANSVWLAPYGVLEPLHLSGRRLYVGYPYFVESAGYNWQARQQWLDALRQPEATIADRWALLELANVGFILLEDHTRYAPWARDLRQHLPTVYQNAHQQVLSTRPNNTPNTGSPAYAPQ